MESAPPTLATPDPIATDVVTGAIAVSRWADYYELTKPRLNLLVVLTTLVGAIVAQRNALLPASWWTITHAILGTALVAASAAVLNQTIERVFDARMRRTRNRPIAAGRVQAVEGFVLGAVLGLIGVTYLSLAVNAITAALGATTWILYVMIYTPLKRLSWTNTIVGAVVGGLPPAMGVTAVTGGVTPLAAMLFALLFCWQMPHFYALALMYREDYAAGGFRMLPGEPNGDRRTRVQALAYASALLPIGFMPVLRPVSGAGWIYGVGAAAISFVFLRAAVRCAQRQPNSEKQLFLASIAYLPAILALLAIDQ